MIWFELIMLIISAGVLAGVVYMIAGDLLGAPFVATPKKIENELFDKLKFKHGAKFYDIGSGDGRMVIEAARRNGTMQSVGIEMHPFLVLISRLKARTMKLDNARFIMGNFWTANLSDGDYFYFYLGPKTVENLGRKLMKEGKKGATVISRAFEIKSWKNKQVDFFTIQNSPMWVYEL